MCASPKPARPAAIIEEVSFDLYFVAAAVAAVAVTAAPKIVGIKPSLFFITNTSSKLNYTIRLLNLILNILIKIFIMKR
jgi:hypothetical protein